ncbi:NepR family anti-sigma factor [Oryzifoliimicrobium ureilyticus]|uniref:NepR family anti-sigma factor n=1 Tax=Oryzifoliimicrobium ureilyticus TaxID=3113724 RepID=UPI0030760DB8
MTAKTNDDPESQAPNNRSGDILDPSNQIGVKLRSLYAAAQDEAIPDRFLDLLEKLDQAEMMSSAKTGK